MVFLGNVLGGSIPGLFGFIWASLLYSIVWRRATSQFSYIRLLSTLLLSPTGWGDP